MRHTVFAALCLSPFLVLTASGQVNAPFDPAYGAGINWNGFAGGTSTSIAMERLADGDLQLVGLWNLQQARTPLSARVDTNGLLKEEYGRFGAITDTAGPVGNGYWSRAHIYPDGSHLVLGYPGAGSILCKYLTNGSPDPAFGINGRIYLTSTMDALFSQLGVLPNGRIILAGRTSEENHFMLLALTPTGAVDTGFGTEGMVVREDLRECEGLDVLPDGRFLCLALEGTAPNAPTLLMFDAQGTLDGAFMGDGELNGLPEDLGLEGITHFEYLPDGRLLLCDDERTARLLADGSGADPTFQSYSFGGIRWLEVMADGSIYFTADVDWRLYHLLPNGVRDPGFGINGLIHLDRYRVVKGVVPTDNGLYVHGQLVRTDYTDEMGITRLFPDGSVDSSFANGGTGGYSGHNEDCYAADMTVDAEGRVLGVGGLTENHWLVRLNTEGRPDTSFAQFGITSPYFLRFEHVVTQSNGNVLVIGTQTDGGLFNAWSELARFGPTGELLNQGFQDLRAIISNYQYVRDVLVDGEDRIYIIVASSPGSSQHESSYVGRLLPDGTYDPSFGTDGIFADPYLPLANSGYCIGLFPNGDVLAVQAIADSLSFGMSFNKLQLRRLSPQGTPVTTWGLAGRVRTDLLGTAGLVARPNQLAMLPDGSFLIQYTGFGYNDVTDQYLAKFLEDGTLDPSFGTNGLLALGFAMITYPSDLEMVVQANGRITLATEFYADGEFNYELVRLMPDGSPDLSFGADGHVLLGDPEDYPIIAVDLALDPLGQVVVSGSINSDPRWGQRDWFTFRLSDDFSTALHDRSTRSGDGHLLAYPNPATAQTRISYSLDHASEVSIRLLDMNGNLVAGKDRLQRPAGAHEEWVSWPAGAAAGTYLARIQCAHWTKVVPVVLVR